MITYKKGEWFEISVPSEWEGMTIEQLFRNIWHAPKKLTHSFRIEKQVTVNHQIANWNVPLHKGERLQIKLFKEEEFGVIPHYIDVEVLFEDDHLLVVNKPPGLSTHPNSPEQTDSLTNAVAFYLQAKGEWRHVKHIHRLDRETSGVILFAKHALIGSILDKMLEERKIRRTYVALVQGEIKRKKGIINAPIGRDRHHPTRRRVSPNGQIAITHYEVLHTNHQTTKVQCQLETGRTHQIRVHFSSIGHPLLGDKLYGDSSTFKRLALHAERLEFIHPLTNEIIDVSSKINWQ